MKRRDVFRLVPLGLAAAAGLLLQRVFPMAISAAHRKTA